MLSIFPQLLFLAPFGPLLLRIALAITFFIAAWSQYRSRSAFMQLNTGAELIIGGFLFAGIFTQIAAIAAALSAAGWLICGRRCAPGFSKGVVMLILVIALSLIVTGAGAFAFDLPL